MMKIDENSPEQAYLQLAAHLRQQIASGEITVKLPSITELAVETHLTVGTIRRAIGVLADERLVQTVPGRGTLLTPPGSRNAGR